MCKSIGRISIIYFITLFYTGLLSAAETGKIAGRVTDKKTGRPLVGANVVVNAVWINDDEVELSNPLGAATDQEGYYFILNVRPGEYSVNCYYMGYRTEKVTRVRVFIDRTTELNFEMETEILKGREVLVTAYKPHKVEKDLTATKQTYTIDEVEQIAGVSDISDILELQADVIDNHFRGGREGESLYLIGGGSINNPLDGSRSFQPMVTALQEVEVLTSGFSAEYGNAQSGVINMVPREGGTRWRTRIDLSMDLPHYQVWGGNPYAEKNMPFYTLLSQPEEWLNPYFEDGQYKLLIRDWEGYLPYESHYSAISDTIFRSQIMYNDSLRIAKMAAVNWLQMARYVGMKYDNIPQHRIDISTGGPLSDNIRLFIAARQEKETPVVTVPHVDLLRQWMNNLTIQLTQIDKLTLSYHYNYSFSNHVSGPTNWFDTIIHNSKTVKTDQYAGIRWNHIFNQASYLDLALRMLHKKDQERLEYLDPDRFISNGLNGYNTLNTYAGRFDNTPSGHRANNIGYNRGTEKIRTYTFEGSYVNQINPNNLLKSGLQLHLYTIGVDQQFHVKSPGEHSYTDYTVNPYEGAFYLQDKMEFQGFIANIGARYDFYNFNYNYFSNLYTPLFNPEFPEQGKARDPEYALKEKTRPFGRLQPRLGISFPVSENTVFHLNYGTFIQRPGFNYILRTELTSRGEIEEIGNARLRPEKTSAWDIGIVYALPLGFRIDLSAYFKDVNNLTEEAYYVNASNEVYLNYANRDYANIKGFNVNLERSGDFWNTYLKYNYQTAKGKASAPGGAKITFYEESLSDGTTVELPDPRDIYMDYDRTHRFIANLRLHTGTKAGPQILKFRPFASLSLSATYKYQSGRPYTDDEQLIGLVFNKRMPGVQDLRLRIQKFFRIGNYRYMVYLEGYNVLNYKEWSRRIFTDKATLLRWKRGDRDELIWYDPTFEEDPNETREIYQYSDAYSVYDNQPRYFRIGLRIQL